MSAEIASVLDKAADVIVERGHYKGNYQGPDGSVCVAGAIRVAVLGTVTTATRTIAQGQLIYNTGLALRSSLDDGGINISAWNDAPERTADDVIAALRKAAEQERNAA